MQSTVSTMETARVPANPTSCWWTVQASSSANPVPTLVSPVQANRTAVTHVPNPSNMMMLIRSATVLPGPINKDCSACPVSTTVMSVWMVPHVMIVLLVTSGMAVSVTLIVQ